MSRVEWHATIREATGVEYAPEAWRAWEAFNLFKGSCVNLTALRLFREGSPRHPICWPSARRYTCGSCGS